MTKTSTSRAAPTVQFANPSGDAPRLLNVQQRSVKGAQALLKLSDGTQYVGRRYLPVGENDCVAVTPSSLAVLAKRDGSWIELGSAWKREDSAGLGGLELPLTFKEIETEQELSEFRELRRFHYRGGGGAGRSVPIIGTTTVTDLPSVIGFVELSSSMIANTARKLFFDAPYREQTGVCWNSWDRLASREYSSLVCRISRFVIHPELRGLGLAALFSRAAREYASERWHYGGYKARFLEITADMLRFYPFVDAEFEFAGDTEGNEHRVTKDMSYLVKKALSPNGPRGMPQGGGGIMTLQRGYANTLLTHMNSAGSSLEDAIRQLQYDPAHLDQRAWESLHKLNRRPKPCYIAGLTDAARRYVSTRATSLERTRAAEKSLGRPKRSRKVAGIAVTVASPISQTTHGRVIQDSFGFVGSALQDSVNTPDELSLGLGEVTLVSGASGAGKSLLLRAIARAFGNGEVGELNAGVSLAGVANEPATVATLQQLDPHLSPLDYMRNSTLTEFLSVAARCGLAEPQLLVRPIWTLSSGQQYRLQLAVAALAKPDVLLIDNFCEALDRFSARAVCKGLLSLTRDIGFTTVVATAAYDRLEAFFEPSQRIMLRRGGKPTVRRGRCDAIQESVHR